MLKAILIDDERNSRESLRKKIETHCPSVTIVAECSSGMAGLEAIRLHTPDIVFLDIEMPEMNGFTMLQQVEEKNFEIIFTTAYNQYAIHAIRCSALDYLVKPVDVEELKQGVQKVPVKKTTSAFNQPQLELLHTLLANRQPQLAKIAVSVASGLEILETARIIYLEAQGNYTLIHIENGKPLLASKTLKEFEELLPPDLFFRVHNASLVNISFIKKYNKGDNGQVVLSNGAVLDVARRRKEELLELLQKIAARI